MGVAGLSSGTAGYVNIVGLPGGRTQSLPTDYINNFQRWQVDMDARLVEHPCAVSMDLPIVGNNLQVRPTLDILLKGGAPAYVMAGLNIRGKDGSNYCPLARQWTAFSFVVEPAFRLETFVGHDKGFESLPLLVDINGSRDIEKTTESFGILLSQLDETSPLSSGFHIVSLPLTYQWADLPMPAKYGGEYNITCFATAEPDAKELLNMDDDLIEMTASSVLEVTVVESKTCSES